MIVSDKMDVIIKLNNIEDHVATRVCNTIDIIHNNYEIIDVGSEKIKSIINHMLGQLQQGEINVDDYGVDGANLNVGYKTALGDCLEETIAQFPELKSFIDEIKVDMKIYTR